MAYPWARAIGQFAFDSLPGPRQISIEQFAFDLLRELIIGEFPYD